MCEIGRRIWLKGFCAGNEGNHSYRLSEDRVLCTPTGISKGQLKPDDMCVVDMEGKQVSGKRGRHQRNSPAPVIYKNRPDIRAVIHSHPPHATAFAMAGMDLPTCIHPEAEVFLGRGADGQIRHTRRHTPGRNARSLHEGFQHDSAGQSRRRFFRHDLEDAYYKLEIVDAYSRILILAKQLGYVQTLSNDRDERIAGIQGQVRHVRWPPDQGWNLGGLNLPAGDFLTRVGGEIATKGRMCIPGGTGELESQPSAMEKAVAALAPENYSEQDIEQLVQVITDQIMATAN